ncbi:hypothetical protein EHP00_736 [Ecytonucleospora hepatopenaei]|uniref:Uncharacterized protein n=1 Tax=Ecytonucleospora hepatopenaei TaxID=646526 RepID=A0A1W0E3A8_9MICR|nr:hypothetical protein EHP00_736 [Ecytonucleospora hepatopenaei]
MILKLKYNKEPLERLKEIQDLLLSIKQVCENRNEETFPYENVEKIVKIAKEVENELLGNGKNKNNKLEDVSVEFFKKVIQAKDFSKILEGYKKEMQKGQNAVTKKQKKFEEISKKL